MRIKTQKQLYLKPQSSSTSRSEELGLISSRLESLSNYNSILEHVLKDLNPRKKISNRGRNGMTAEQVLRAFILKTRFRYSYRELADATDDSCSAREFLKISLWKKGFKYKTLQSNIKLLSETTLDLLNEEIKRNALSSGIELGEEIRTDGLTTESNIHYPTDWSLMNDGIRILSRTLTRVYEDIRVPIKFTNHYRASKKKLFNINNSHSPKKRQKWNLELIRLCRNTIAYSRRALPIMESFEGCAGMMESVQLDGLISDLKNYIPLVEQALDQAYRRIVKGEKIPANEKIFSLFEPHTDILVKGKRDIVFGHKLTITTGKSGLILDVDIHEGNPADSTLVEGVIKSHKRFYVNVIKKAVFDGCYSSTSNREFAKSEGIVNVCFSKETDEQSSCTRAMRKVLRNFRAGIEATVSMLKRMFGLTRVMDRGLRSFRKAVKAAVITYNLFMLSKIPITT